MHIHTYIHTYMYLTILYVHYSFAWDLLNAFGYQNDLTQQNHDESTHNDEMLSSKYVELPQTSKKFLRNILFYELGMRSNEDITMKILAKVYTHTYTDAYTHTYTYTYTHTYTHTYIHTYIHTCKLIQIVSNDDLVAVSILNDCMKCLEKQVKDNIRFNDYDIFQRIIVSILGQLDGDNCKNRESKIDQQCAVLINGVHILIHTYTHIYIYSYILILIYTYTHTSIYSCIHILIHTYTHIYIYSYTYSHRSSGIGSTVLGEPPRPFYSPTHTHAVILPK